jgi:hypothetical protein
MPITSILNFGGSTNFADPYTQTIDVGSGSDRAAYVLVGRLNSNFPIPNGCTIGSDTLTAQGGAAFTDLDGRSWRLYAGALTVTGSQTLSADYTDANGSAQVIGVIRSGVNTGTLISGLTTGAAYNTTPTATVSSASGDEVVMLICEYANQTRTLTPSSPATVLTGTGISTTFRSIMSEAGASSVTIDGSYSGSAGYALVAFNIPAGGGGGASAPKRGLLLGIG